MKEEPAAKGPPTPDRTYSARCDFCGIEHKLLVYLTQLRDGSTAVKVRSEKATLMIWPRDDY